MNIASPLEQWIEPRAAWVRGRMSDDARTLTHTLTPRTREFFVGAQGRIGNSVRLARGTLRGSPQAAERHRCQYGAAWAQADQDGHACLSDGPSASPPRRRGVKDPGSGLTAEAGIAVFRSESSGGLATRPRTPTRSWCKNPLAELQSAIAVSGHLASIHPTSLEGGWIWCPCWRAVEENSPKTASFCAIDSSRQSAPSGCQTHSSPGTRNYSFAGCGLGPRGERTRPGTRGRPRHRGRYNNRPANLQWLAPTVDLWHLQSSIRGSGETV